MKLARRNKGNHLESNAAPYTHSSPVAEAYDAVASIYDQSYNQKKSLAENRIIVCELQRLLKRYDRVLDLGCGTGFPLDHLVLDPSHYLGVDISPGMIERARAKHPRHRFEVADMCALSMVESGSMDVVISLFGAFSYVLEPDLAVAEMRRVLAPGGKLLLMPLGFRYNHRATYILNREAITVDRRLYSRAALMVRFGWLDSLTVNGLSCLVDGLSERLPQKVFDLYLAAEARTIGRLFADRNYFLVVNGRSR